MKKEKGGNIRRQDVQSARTRLGAENVIKVK